MAESITVSARSLFTQGGSVSWHQYSKVYEVDRERRGVSVCVSPSSMYACGKRAAFDIFCVCVCFRSLPFSDISSLFWAILICIFLVQAILEILYHKASVVFCFFLLDPVLHLIVALSSHISIPCQDGVLGPFVQCQDC